MNQYRRPEKDTVNPPGQIVNPVPATVYKPTHGGYPNIDPRFAAAHYQDGRDLKHDQEAMGSPVGIHPTQKTPTQR